ncbi:MAG: inorganic diphosphatase [Methylosarcina sp.]
MKPLPLDSLDMDKKAPLVDVVIEIPRGSFLKQGSTGELDYISPVPCPFNYGSVPAFVGLDGDLLDAVVLGPRLPRGARVRVHAWAAIGLIDHGFHDDKLICAYSPIPPWKRRLILLFFMIYARAKSLLNLIKGNKGRNSCEGWHEAASALARATPRIQNDRNGAPTSK